MTGTDGDPRAQAVLSDQIGAYDGMQNGDFSGLPLPVRRAD